jgi:hypothetical protein
MSTKYNEVITHAVWWASAGCLPDSEEPAFVGDLQACREYAENDPDGYYDNVGIYNLYYFIIEPYDPEEE